MTMNRTVFAMIMLTAAASVSMAAEPDHAAKMAAGQKLFAGEVRAILTEHCVRCHGGEKISSGLNLATRDRLLSGGTHGTAVKPGRHADSLLYQKITHADEPGMPFKRPKLSDAQIAAIAKWIDLGAPYDKPLVDDPDAASKRPSHLIADIDREHWAYQPLSEAEPPALANDGWVRTPIDRFVLAKLRNKGLAPNKMADKRTLIRRIYLDLIGLPPTPQQVEAFVADTSADALGRVVDGLLADSAYGERWARHWLDVARFGESGGYEQDYDRKHAYPYRDFVIRALNDDMPYDQFVRWQIAGDELAPGDPMAMRATGFLGAGAFPTQLTEKEFESSRYTELDDMAQTVGASFLGLTIGCARCHDHKYDAIPAYDYYSFVANFTTTIRSEVKLPTMVSKEEAAKANADHAKRISQLKSQVVAADAEAKGGFDRYLDTLREGKDSTQTWQAMQIAKAAGASGTVLTPQADGSLLANGKIPAKDVYTFTANTTAMGITALRIEALTHKSLPKNGPGLAANGNFALGKVTVAVAPADGSAKAIPVKLIGARATHQQDAGQLSVKASIDRDGISGWAVDRGGIGKDQAAVFDFDKPVGFAGGSVLTITLHFEHPNTKHAMGRPRLSITTSPAPVKPTVGGAGLPADIAMLVKRVRTGQEIEGEQLTALRKHYESTQPAIGKLRAQLAALEKAGPAVPMQTVMITSEGVKPRKHHADGRGFPHFYKETHHLSRGDVNNKGEVATASYLQPLMRNGKTADHWRVDPPAGSKLSYRRAGLAKWMSDVDDGAGHLVARVIVNRLWHHHFGRGLSSNPIDLGIQGTEPTHPDLLDWLARDLIANDWSLKRLHKLIVTSAVYTQSSETDAARFKIDPENTLRWRWTPRRLEAEPIRDSILAVAGRLDRTMYGPGTLNENMTRRSVYFFIKRSRLIPSMMLFDWPEHLVPIGTRSSTTIAPQALAFMNSPQVRASAQALADRVAKSQDPIKAVYELALSRAPTSAEHLAADGFVSSQAEAYLDAGRKDGQRLALIDFCQSVFSLNEFIYLN